MRAVAIEREKIRQRERERMAQENQKIKLRQSPKQYIQTIVDQFNLSKWVGQEGAAEAYTGRLPRSGALRDLPLCPDGNARSVCSVRRDLSVFRDQA